MLIVMTVSDGQHQSVIMCIEGMSCDCVPP
jgi:hypothetical protein